MKSDHDVSGAWALKKTLIFKLLFNIVFNLGAVYANHFLVYVFVLNSWLRAAYERVAGVREIYSLVCKPLI